MKTGLIMEGGAMRGMFTAGVIDVLMENGIEFDGAIGASAGAVFGCNYKSKQIGRAIRYNKKYCNDPRYAGFRSLLKTGDIYGADFCYREIPQNLDVFDVDTFEKNPMDFYVVCTDVQTGEAVYYKCTDGGDNDVLWMRASASMPMVSKFVKADGYTLSDGGTADSIPIKYFESIGYDRNIVILTQPKGFLKKPNKYLPIMRKILRKTPELIRALEERPQKYNDTVSYIEQREAEGALLAIRPPKPLNIGAVEHDPQELERVYQLGRAQANEQFEQIINFLRGEEK